MVETGQEAGLGTPAFKGDHLGRCQERSPPRAGQECGLADAARVAVLVALQGARAGHLGERVPRSGDFEGIKRSGAKRLSRTGPSAILRS